MKAKKGLKRRWVLAILAVSLMVVLGVAGIALAQVEPVGDDCWKIDNPQSQSYVLGDCTVQLTFTSTADGEEFSFTVTDGDCEFGQVRVFGGSSEEVFNYPGGTSSGSGLHAPENPSGDWADVSHITFCLSDETTTTEPVTTTELVTTTTEPVTTTTVEGVTTTTSEAATTTTVEGVTTTTAEAGTTTTVGGETSTTVGGETSTTVGGLTSTTVGGLTTVSAINTGQGRPSSGPGAAFWALAAFAIALAGGVGWSLVRGARR